MTQALSLTTSKTPPFIDFDRWTPSSKGTLYVMFPTQEEAISLTSRINELFPESCPLAFGAYIPSQSKYIVKIDKKNVTGECLQNLPGLKKLIDCYLPRDGIQPWNETEIEEKNSRISVNSIKEMHQKLDTAYQNAQENLDVKAFHFINFLERPTPKECKTGYQTIDYKQLVGNLNEDEAGACLFPCGGASTQGDHNDHMEDVTLVSVIDNLSENGPRYFPLYAVFDGHGGTDCSEFLGDHLPDYLQKQLFKIYQLPEDKREIALFNMFKVCGVDLTRAFLESTVPSNLGSTMVFMLVIEGYLWVVNVGDSRAILSANGETIALSEDADLIFKKYQNGAMKRGAEVVHFNDVHRVSGVAMGRAVGHAEYEGINPRSTILRLKLEGLDRFKHCKIVIASDGLWDVGTTEEVSEFVYKLSKQGLNCDMIARQLVERAFNIESPDNISVLVIELPCANQNKERVNCSDV